MNAGSRELPLLARRGAEHIKKCCEATTACEAGAKREPDRAKHQEWWSKFDKIY